VHWWRRLVGVLDWFESATNLFESVLSVTLMLIVRQLYVFLGFREQLLLFLVRELSYARYYKIEIEPVIDNIHLINFESNQYQYHNTIHFHYDTNTMMFNLT